MKVLNKIILLKEKREKRSKSPKKIDKSINNTKKLPKIAKNNEKYYLNGKRIKGTVIINKFAEEYHYVNDYEYFSNTKKRNIKILSRENNIFDRIENIMAQEKSKNTYKTKVINYFNCFIEFLEKNSKSSKSQIIKIIRDKNETFYVIPKIIISDIHDFVNSKFYSFKDKTKNIILSIMRKFVRMLNNDKNLNYSNKLFFYKSNNNCISLSEKELCCLINYLKDNNELQNLIIFYFLYYSGLNYSSLARCKIKNFYKDFSILKFAKNKTRKIHIPFVIKMDILNFLENNKKISGFIFYNDYNEKLNPHSRVLYIKNELMKSIRKFKGLSEQKKNLLIQSFSKTRRYKILSKKYELLFDYNYRDIDDSSLPNLFFQSSEKSQNSFASPKKEDKMENNGICNEKKNAFENDLKNASEQEKEYNIDFDDLSYQDKSFFEDKSYAKFLGEKRELFFDDDIKIFK